VTRRFDVCRRCGFLHRPGAHQAGPFVRASSIVQLDEASDREVQEAIEALLSR
jgi:hypothetical protein